MRESLLARTKLMLTGVSMAPRSVMSPTRRRRAKPAGPARSGEYFFGPRCLDFQFKGGRLLGYLVGHLGNRAPTARCPRKGLARNARKVRTAQDGVARDVLK
jgi:hypothetical protein